MQTPRRVNRRAEPAAETVRNPHDTATDVDSDFIGPARLPIAGAPLCGNRAPIGEAFSVADGRMPWPGPSDDRSRNRHHALRFQAWREISGDMVRSGPSRSASLLKTTLRRR